MIRALTIFLSHYPPTASTGKAQSTTQKKVATLVGSISASMNAEVSLLNFPQSTLFWVSATGSGLSDPPPARMEYTITGQVSFDGIVSTHVSTSHMLQTGTGAENILQSHFFCDSTVEPHGTPLWMGPDSSLGVCKKSVRFCSNHSSAKSHCRRKRISLLILEQVGKCPSWCLEMGRQGLVEWTYSR